MLQRHGHSQIHRHRGFAFILQQAGDHHHFFAVHMVFHPAGQFTEGLHKTEAGQRIGYQNIDLLSFHKSVQISILALMGHFADTAAIQFGFRLLDAADRIPVIRHIRQQRHHSNRRQQHRLFRQTRGAGNIIGGHRYRRTAQQLQRYIVHHLVGHALVILHDGPGHQKYAARIMARHRNIQKVGFGHHLGGDGAVKDIQPAFCQDLALQQGAIEQFLKHRCHSGSRAEIAVYRGRAAAGIGNIGEAGAVLGAVGNRRIGISAHARHQHRQQDQRPSPGHIPHQHDGIKF